MHDANIKREQVSKVIWQKSASRTSNPTLLRMDSSNPDHHLALCTLDPHESASRIASQSVQPFFAGLGTFIYTRQLLCFTILFI